MLQVLDGIQDNYTFAQPGIQTKIRWEIAVHIWERKKRILKKMFLKIWHHILKQAVRGTTEEGGSHPAHTHCQQRCPVSSIQLQVKQLEFIEECQHDFQVDEQSPSAGTPSQCHHPFVGHLSGWAWRVQVILIIKLWIYVFFCVQQVPPICVCGLPETLEDWTGTKERFPGDTSLHSGFKR